ncbi:hypothetical protein QVD17_37332 [Tagetes erecta]|uniref:Uncharacterized protein n=1 Tax=Tagetes erecta TaxID=13708 RepID=A0AAD8NJY6_TARER|nr:hypothetical protein QVD17_37332 [Tagetes erecta]
MEKKKQRLIKDYTCTNLCCNNNTIRIAFISSISSYFHFHFHFHSLSFFSHHKSSQKRLLFNSTHFRCHSKIKQTIRIKDIYNQIDDLLSD